MKDNVEANRRTPEEKIARINEILERVERTIPPKEKLDRMADGFLAAGVEFYRELANQYEVGDVCHVKHDSGIAVFYVATEEMRDKVFEVIGKQVPAG